jgi:hypothetical protein
MSEMGNNGSSHGVWTMQEDPHQEFQELCALSTTGELTVEEWARLNEHLAHCDSCREAKRQYLSLIAATFPVLGAESSEEDGSEDAPGSWSIEEAEAKLMESLRDEPIPSGDQRITLVETSGWKHVRRYAVAALILAVCSVAGYRVGVHRGAKSDAATVQIGSIAQTNPPRVIPSIPATTPAHQDKTPPADDKAAGQRNQARLNQQELTRLKDQLNQVEKELGERTADLDRSLAERADLKGKLDEAHSNALSLEARLSLIGNQNSEDTQQSLALKGQVNDLSAAIKEKDTQIADERELLERDRDIRNLIGARNLYIAEIYDVGQSGDTQKPFGRVFYTKDKSLIFYGYDLDQQPGLKKTGAFQAWGGRGADRQHAFSLGLLYRDDANQKRWVLKFNDAKTISQIDAVFVTVEPEGGSPKPSGKPLLFTYLRLDPNHP